ncbi:hypothetical protein [Bdellovibrio sp. HCB337]|uniref:hypothetical protein n=1 Tax=Bdellovibrio sp. HCB337 TaxID=3394358 RepID=UPI0039A743AA
MKKLVFICLVYLLGCSTAVIKTPVNNVGELKEAIRDNNFSKVKHMLEGQSFKGKELTLFEDRNGASYRYSSEATSYALLELAIAGKDGNSFGQSSYGVCRIEIVQALLEADLPPRADDLVNAAEAPCPQIVEILVERLSQERIDTGATSFLKEFIEKIQFGNENNRRFENYSFYQKELDFLRSKVSAGILVKIDKAEALLQQYVARPAQDSQEEKQRLEAKYKIPLCKQSDLFSALYRSDMEKVDSGCLYILRGPFRVLQAVKEGVLVTVDESFFSGANNIFFLRTFKKYVDQEYIGTLLVSYFGPTKYINVLGVEKTVRAFQYLEDIQTIRGAGYGEYNLAPRETGK